MKEMLKTVHHECASLCTLKEPSIFRKTSKDEIHEFTFEKLQDELSVRAPVFNAVLKTASLKAPEKTKTFFGFQLYGGSNMLKESFLSPYSCSATCVSHTTTLWIDGEKYFCLLSIYGTVYSNLMSWSYNMAKT